MKFLSNALFALACVGILALASCKMPVNNDKPASKDAGESYESRLNKMLGKWENIKPDFQNFHDLYTITPNSVIVNYGQGPQWVYTEDLAPKKILTVDISADYKVEYANKFSDNDVMSYTKGHPEYKCCVYKLSGEMLIVTSVYNGKITQLRRISSSGGSSSGTVTLSGGYNITNSNQTGSSFTMTNGNWTYKYNTVTTTGTYSQSGNELTVNYTNQNNTISAVFTISKSNNIITLTDKSGATTSIRALVFMTSENVVKLTTK